MKKVDQVVTLYYKDIFNFFLECLKFYNYTKIVFGIHNDLQSVSNVLGHWNGKTLFIQDSPFSPMADIHRGPVFKYIL